MTHAARRAVVFAALLCQAWAAQALEFGPLVLRRDVPPGLLGHFRLSDRAPLDPASLSVRLAHPDAYAALGLVYERSLASTAVSLEPTMDSALTVMLRPLPQTTAGNRPLDILVLVFEGTRLSTRQYRVDLRSSRSEFAALDPAAEPAPLAAATLSQPAVVPPLRGAPAPTEPAATPMAADPAQAEVARAVRRWAAAWSSRDVEAYAAAYTHDFHAGHASRSDWLAARRSRILAKREIEVSVSALRIELRERQAEVRFMQHYRGDALRLNDRKRLLMVRQGDAWLIREEATL